jgi:hypothetical protein
VTNTPIAHNFRHERALARALQSLPSEVPKNNMSRTRTVLSGIVSLLALAVAAPAQAAGQRSIGQEFSRQASSGDFGGSFDIYARATARDYAQLCTESDPAVVCKNKAPIFKFICTSIAKQVHAGYCAKSGYGFDAGAGANASVTLFGKGLPLFDVNARIDAEPDATTSSYGLYIGGAKVFGASGGVSLTKKVNLGERTFVKASTTVMMGPIPIDLEASATGNLGIDFALTGGTGQVSASATPWATVDGVVSAGIGVSWASVGVEGELLLVGLSTPGTVTIAHTAGRNFTYDAKLDLTLTALDGTVRLYAQGGPYKVTKDIFSWSGLSYSTTLGEKSGPFSL